ncbi:threonine-phosphate decarboxylase [Shewanella livingstonensis]
MHGGRLRLASDKYQIPFSNWLDLSTGVSPWTYPFTNVDTLCWNRLPEEEDGLEAAARQYYQTDSLLAVAGSQMAIQLLPKVWLDHLKEKPQYLSSNINLKVGLPKQGYKEHEKAWLKAGWQVVHYDGVPSSTIVADVNALVVINPNNPSGLLISNKQLLEWHQLLSANDGLLVVDEAFADIDNNSSLSHLCPKNNLIILRSIGKFFGLAGIRVGFVIANTPILHRLAAEIGPWIIAGPSREVTKQALEDSGWHKFQCARLKKSTERLAVLLTKIATNQIQDPHDLSGNTERWRISGSSLFQTLYLPNAKEVHDNLCKEAVFVRLTDEEDALRFGLPLNEDQWLRLESVLPKVLTLK